MKLHRNAALTLRQRARLVSLVAAGSLLFLVGFVPIGVSILAASLGMLGSDLFARWLRALGAVVGAIVIVGGIVRVVAAGETGGFHDAAETSTTVGAIGFWIWLIATSVILWRRAPGRAPKGP